MAPRRTVRVMPPEGNGLVGIDELLDTGTYSVADIERRTGRRLRRRHYDARWWIRHLFFALAIATVLFGILWILRILVPYPLVLTSVFAVLVLRDAIANGLRVDGLPPEVTGAGLDLLPDDDPVMTFGGLREATATADGVRFAVARWDDRLTWGERDPSRFGTLVLPRLSDLVDERLRQRHGITRQGDPARARELLGDPLWTLLTTRPKRPPGPRDVASIVATVEAL